jgi:hypothetical protein
MAFASTQAVAQQTARLKYQLEPGAEACANEAALRSAVKARLGYEAIDEHAEREIRATVRAAGAGLEATVQLEGAGSQQLSSTNRDCVELSQTLALVIAIAVDPVKAQQLPPIVAQAPSPPPAAPKPKPRPTAPSPSKLTGEIEEPEQPPVEEKPEPVPANLSREVAIAPSSASPSRRGLEVGGGLGLVVLGTVGTSVGPTAAGGLFGFLDLDRWSIGIELRAGVPARLRVGNGSVTSSLFSGTLSGCRRLWLAQVCVLGAAGAQLSQGEGFADARSATDPFAAAGARLALSIPLSERLAVRAQADALFPFTRTRLRVSQVLAYETPWITASAGAGLELRF